MGTTLKQIFLSPYFKKYNLDWRWSAILQISPRELRDLEFVAGHFHMGCKYCFEYEPRIITMLRQPVQRAYSMFNFIKRTPQHYLHNRIKTWPIEKILDSEYGYILSNGQSRFIGNHKIPDALTTGTSVSDKDMTIAIENWNIPGDELLQSAKLGLKNTFWYGTAENFYEDVHQLWDKMGVEPLGMTDNLRCHYHDIDKKHHRLLEKANQIDLELYEYAVENKQWMYV